MERFYEHNKHWTSLASFAKDDPHLRNLQKLRLVYTPSLMFELPQHVPGIYTLSGGRQIGKTTLLKQWMHYLLDEKKNSFYADNIYFMTGELIADHTTLIQLIESFLQKQHLPYNLGTSLSLIIIDEVTYIHNWDQGVKYLADSGAFENTIVLLTGSDSSFIKEARMRFPGRRGKAEKQDFHLYPLSFYEYVRLKFKKSLDKDPLKREEAFVSYLQHGGILTAINDVEQQKGEIQLSTYRTYSDWIRGDFLKHGKSEGYLREILRAIIKTYGTQVSWNKLTKHTSIGHHDTVRQYTELLEDMDVVYVQHALREDTLTAAPKKEKKVIFKDPFIYRALHLWALSSLPENKDMESLLVEATVVSHYVRFYEPCCYIKGEGEVDLVYIRNGKFYPIEVKWRNQIRSKDLKQINKYPQGLIVNKALQSGKLERIPTEPIPQHLDTFYIRERLEGITRSVSSQELEMTNYQQIDAIRELLRCEGDIEKIQEPTMQRLNGFAYALHLNQSSYFQDIFERSVGSPLHLISPSFMKMLLQKKILREQKENEHDENSLVLYFDEQEENIMHAGYWFDCLGKAIKSKWGTFPYEITHRLWDIPRSYGTRARYFQMPFLPELEKVYQIFSQK